MRILSDIISDYDKPLMTDIQVVNSDQECPFEYEPILTANWPGIEKGCFENAQFVKSKDRDESKVCLD